MPDEKIPSSELAIAYQLFQQDSINGLPAGQCSDNALEYLVGRGYDRMEAMQALVAYTDDRISEHETDFDYSRIIKYASYALVAILAWIFFIGPLFTTYKHSEILKEFQAVLEPIFDGGSGAIHSPDNDQLRASILEKAKAIDTSSATVDFQRQYNVVVEKLTELFVAIDNLPHGVGNLFSDGSAEKTVNARRDALSHEFDKLINIAKTE